VVFMRNQELWNKIWQMHENGESIYKIAKKLNVSTSTVHYAIKKMKKEREEPNKVQVKEHEQHEEANELINDKMKKEREEPNKVQVKEHEQHEEANELINDITAKKEEAKKKKKKEIREVDRIWAILEI